MSDAIALGWTLQIDRWPHTSTVLLFHGLQLLKHFFKKGCESLKVVVEFWIVLCRARSWTSIILVDIL